MKLTKQQAIQTVEEWISSSRTLAQLECCLCFIHDTLYLRFGADLEIARLKTQVIERINLLK